MCRGVHCLRQQPATTNQLIIVPPYREQSMDLSSLLELLMIAFNCKFCFIATLLHIETGYLLRRPSAGETVMRPSFNEPFLAVF